MSDAIQPGLFAQPDPGGVISCGCCGREGVEPPQSTTMPCRCGEHCQCSPRITQTEGGIMAADGRMAGAGGEASREAQNSRPGRRVAGRRAIKLRTVRNLNQSRVRRSLWVSVNTGG